MNGKEWRVVDSSGEPVDEGLDVAWVIYDKRAAAEERRREFDRECPEGAPHRVQGRRVESWSR